MKRVVLLSLVATANGCIIDAPHYVTEYEVAGSVNGMWDGARVQLHLVSDGVDEMLEVDANAEFIFESGLGEGASYEVTVASQPEHHTCTVTGGSGTADDGIAPIAVQCAGPAVDVAVSAPIAWSFDPSLASQSADVSVLIQRLATTVTAPDASEIRINDVVATSGDPLPDVPLALGSNMFTIDIVADSVSKSFEITFDRGAAIVEQYVYGKASNPDMNDMFGYSVDVSGDTIVVGAISEDSAATGVGGDQGNQVAGEGSGAVYVFRRGPTGWAQEAYIKASNPDGNDYFGTSVSIDDDTLAVSALFEDGSGTGVGGSQSDGKSESGAVYVFRRTGTTWAQEAYVKATNSEANDFFGEAVAVFGNRLAVGASGEASNATGVGGSQTSNALPGAGAVYLYSRSGSVWTPEVYVKASNTTTGASVAGFGRSVDLTADTLVVGAPLENCNSTGVNGIQTNSNAGGSGAVYVFHFNGATWAQQAYVKASNTDPSDTFGSSVSIDGDVLVVGAPNEDGAAAESGAAYVFGRTGSTWTQVGYLKGGVATAADHFGRRVAVRGDVIVATSTNEDGAATQIDDTQDEGAQDSGAAYLFVNDGTSWLAHAYIKVSNTGAGDALGSGVALSSDGLVVAATGEDGGSAGIGGDPSNNGSQNSGAIFSFR